MEKEEKGLFGKLLAFWKEKIGFGEAEGRGIWNGMADAGRYFAEEGSEAILNQAEMKKALVGGWLQETEKALAEEWMQETKTVSQEENIIMEEKIILQKEMDVFQEEREKPLWMMPEKESETGLEKREEEILSAAVFLNEKNHEENEGLMEKSLKEVFWEEPRKKRKIIPVVQEAEPEKELPMENTEEKMSVTEKRKETAGAESVVDIDGLMRQITRKLWEEREGCGRRLR